MRTKFFLSFLKKTLQKGGEKQNEMCIDKEEATHKGRLFFVKNIFYVPTES